MGGSVNEPNLAKEWQYPGMQARQPLAEGNNQQDALSSTESLQGDFFGEGGLSSALKQALGTDTIPGFDNSGMFGGGSSNTGGGSTPFTALPNTPIGGNAPSLPTGDFSNYSGSDSTYTNSGMGGASNSNNFLSEWASSIDLGGSYNPDFFNEPAGLGSSDYFSSNSLFNFGNQALGSNIPGIGDFAKANSIANKFGYGNENVNNAMNVLGLTGNKLFDYAADATGNDYLGMLNDDFSQRGIVNKSLRMGGVPYSSAIMAGLDYQQGVTDWGNIASTAGGMLLGPAGALAGYLGGNYFGGKDYNDNWVGPSAEWAQSLGLEQGTESYDHAIDTFRGISNNPKALAANPEMQRYIEDWKNDKFDQKWLEDNMLGGRSIDEGVDVPPANIEEALEDGVPFGKEGDESWTDGTTTFHSGGYNWNNDTNSGSDSFGNDIGGGSDSSGSGGTDVTGATADDYSSYDNPDESSGSSWW